MAERTDIDADVAILRALIDGPDRDLAEFLDGRPYLRTPDEARDELARLVAALEDVRAGRVVGHAQVVADAAARRRRFEPQAAE